MVWFFERSAKVLELETRHDNDTAKYVLELRGPDVAPQTRGSPTPRHFAHVCSPLNAASPVSDGDAAARRSSSRTAGRIGRPPSRGIDRQIAAMRGELRVV